VGKDVKKIAHEMLEDLKQIISWSQWKKKSRWHSFCMKKADV